MIPLLKRAWVCVAFCVLLFSVIGVSTKKLEFFVAPNTGVETAAYYLLSTLVQSVAAFTAVVLAVFFLTAQSSFVPPHSRIIALVYRNVTAVGAVCFFCFTLVVGVVSLSRVEMIVTSENYSILDFNVLLSISALLLLPAFVLDQIENLDPYLLALKLRRTIKPRLIESYGLAKVSRNSDTATGYLCVLDTWGYEGGREDPLGWFHDILMASIRSRDRLLLASLIRILLSRIARFAGVQLLRLELGPKSTLWRSKEVWSVVWRWVHRPIEEERQMRFALHLLHYIVRRAHNLRDEWGELDAVRKQFVENIVDLIEALNQKKGTEWVIELCLLALLHICVGYKDVHLYGHREPLHRLYPISQRLFTNGKARQAVLCVRILAFLTMQSKLLPTGFEYADKLKMELQEVFLESIIKSNFWSGWLPTEGVRDPWEYKWSKYFAKA